MINPEITAHITESTDASGVKHLKIDGKNMAGYAFTADLTDRPDYAHYNLPASWLPKLPVGYVGFYNFPGKPVNVFGVIFEPVKNPI